MDQHGLRGQPFSLIPSSVLWVCFIFPVRCVLVSHSNKKGMEHGKPKHLVMLHNVSLDHLQFTRSVTQMCLYLISDKQIVQNLASV